MPRRGRGADGDIREEFAQLDELADDDAILASNSSSLPTSQFIDEVKHPSAC
jgi:3-hydroxybutyryl-CoA dehydrogenase